MNQLPANFRIIVYKKNVDQYKRASIPYFLIVYIYIYMIFVASKVRHISHLAFANIVYSILHFLFKFIQFLKVQTIQRLAHPSAIHTHTHIYQSYMFSKIKKKYLSSAIHLKKKIRERKLLQRSPCQVLPDLHPETPIFLFQLF